MDIPIIFENEELLVINKPVGVVVNRAESTKGETIQDWIDTRQNKVLNLVRTEFYEKSGIVHRLDKDTSGVLIIAKTEKAYLNLKAQFQERKVVKKYLTMVHGEVEPREGEINAPIERSPINRMHFGIFPGGREALTKYKVLKYLKFPMYPKEIYTYLEVEPKTGRTHQIRVHMKYLGHSVVSDPLYAGRKQLIRDRAICSRMFLHAAYLEISGQSFVSTLPIELQKVLD